MLVQLQKVIVPGVPFNMPASETLENYPLLLAGPSGICTTQAQYQEMTFILQEEQAGRPVVVGQELLESDDDIESINFFPSEQLSDSDEEHVAATVARPRQKGLIETMVLSDNAQMLADNLDSPPFDPAFYHECMNLTKTAYNLMTTGEQQSRLRRLLNKFTSSILSETADKVSRNDTSILVSSQPEIETMRRGKRYRSFGHI